MRRVTASLETLGPRERLPEAVLPPKEGNLSALLLETEAPPETRHDKTRSAARSFVSRFFGFGSRD